MAGDIAQHATIVGALEEPCRPQVPIEPVRAKANGLHHPANRPGVHQIEGRA